MRQHSFVIEAESEEGIAHVLSWLASELKMETKGNPDIIISRHKLFSVEDARTVTQHASQKAFSGENRAIIITAHRVYHQAQNALLKLFEEPSPGTHLFLILPTLGGLLPTLRSRVQVLHIKNNDSLIPHESKYGPTRSIFPDADLFLKGGREKRNAIIKSLTNGKDEESRHKKREEAIALINGMESIGYQIFSKKRSNNLTAFLTDLVTLRGFLYERSASLKMILSHLSIVIPKELL